MEKVKLGIIGIGNMGTAHANNILESHCPNFTIIAVADYKKVRLDWAKGAIEDVTTYEDGMELLKNQEIEAVLIAVPHYEHTKYAIEAMKRNLHVMCEKPAGVYTKQVREMNAVAEQSDVVFGMMFNQRTNPLYRKMRELVQSGTYGELKRVNWIITSWFRTQYYYDSGDWRATWKGEGGGVLLNQCPHQLDLLQWICGMPCKVLAKLQYGKWHDIEVEDDVTAYLEYPNGATGVFVTSTGDAHGTNRLEIQLDKARIVVEGNGMKVLEYAESTQAFLQKEQSGYASVATKEMKFDLSREKPTAHVGVLNAFANKIRGMGELIADGVEGIHGLELSNAMHLSSFLNREIELPFDDDLYYEELMKRVATSKEKHTMNIDVVDVRDASHGVS